MSRIIIIMLLGSIFLSCQQERNPCLLPTAVNLRLKSISKFTKADTNFNRFNLIAVDGDTLKYLYFGQNNIARFSLRLSPQHDSCRYIIQADSSLGLYDTLAFYYARKLQYISDGCGYTYFFDLNKIIHTQHQIDSIAIINSEVNTNANTNPLEHVQIYF